MIVILVHPRRLCIFTPPIPRRFPSCFPLFRFVFLFFPFLWVFTILDPMVAIMVSPRHIAHVITPRDVLCHPSLSPPLLRRRRKLVAVCCFLFTNVAQACCILRIFVYV